MALHRPTRQPAMRTTLPSDKIDSFSRNYNEKGVKLEWVVVYEERTAAMGGALATTNKTKQTTAATRTVHIIVLYTYIVSKR
jgi:hypothetical protein